MEDQDIELLAIEGYHAYGSEVGWKNYAGLPMPTWPELTDKIRSAWRAHTRAVIAGVAKRRIAAFRDDPSLSWEERFKLLEQHHTHETVILASRFVVSPAKV